MSSPHKHKERMIHLRKREIEAFYKDINEQQFFEGNFQGSAPEDFNALMELRSGVIGSRTISEEKLEDEVWGQVKEYNQGKANNSKSQLDLVGLKESSRVERLRKDYNHLKVEMAALEATFEFTSPDEWERWFQQTKKELFEEWSHSEEIHKIVDSAALQLIPGQLEFALEKAGLPWLLEVVHLVKGTQNGKK